MVSVAEQILGYRIYTRVEVRKTERELASFTKDQTSNLTKASQSGFCNPPAKLAVILQHSLNERRQLRQRIRYVASGLAAEMLPQQSSDVLRRHTRRTVGLKLPQRCE